VKKVRALAVSIVVLSLVAAACGSSKKSGSSADTATTAKVKEGGDLVFAAEQEPDCMDWIGSCAGAAWGVYMVEGLVMPRSFDFTSANDYKPSVLLDGEPKLETSPQMKVTYKINPNAKWDDGQPITSHDYKYTWDQIAHGKDSYDKSGYELISNVDDSDPKTAVVTFSKNYSPWRDLFGGYFGVLPSHILEGKDRDALMKDGFTFSGGPWKLDHWTKGTEVKLVPNTNYWGPKPHLSSITFKIQADTAAEQAAYQSGQVSMVYPQAQPGQEKLKGLPDTSFDAKSGLSFEGLWFNTEKAPLNDLNVRKALAFATDRDAIVKQLFGPVQPDIQRIDSFMTPAFGKYYGTQFSVYSPVNTSKVDELMKASGYAKGADGIWAKGGKPVTLELKTTTGNKRRELTAQILQSQWKAAGFNLTLTTEKAGVLFGQDLPKGNFQIGLYAQTPASNDPSYCVLWCTKNIPTAANGNSGNNWTRLANVKAIDDNWQAVETELDDAKKLVEVKAGQQAIADNVPGLPLDPFPDIIVYNTAKIAGPVTHNMSFGPWVNAHLWSIK
jgi:peptide/nickel transport system substrate-binding protein